MLVDSMPREYRHLQTLAHCACCNAGLDSIFHDYAFLTVSRREFPGYKFDFLMLQPSRQHGDRLRPSTSELQITDRDSVN